MKGKVKILALGHKNGSAILKAGDVVTENDVDNFMSLVKNGSIEPDKATKDQMKKADKEASEKALKNQEDAAAQIELSSKAANAAQDVIAKKDEEIVKLETQILSLKGDNTKVGDLEKQVTEANQKVINIEADKVEIVKAKDIAETKVGDLEKQVETLAKEVEKLKTPK